MKNISQQNYIPLNSFDLIKYVMGKRMFTFLQTESVTEIIPT